MNEAQQFKVGDQVYDAHKRTGTVIKISKKSITVKMPFCTIKQTLNSSEGVFSFWKF